MRLDSKSTESNANWSSVPVACQALSPRLGATGHLADCRQQGQLLGRGPRAMWSLPQTARVSDHFPPSAFPENQPCLLAVSALLVFPGFHPTVSHRHFFQKHLCMFSLILMSASQKVKKNTSSNPQTVPGRSVPPALQRGGKVKNLLTHGQCVVSKGQGNAPNYFYFFF